MAMKCTFCGMDNPKGQDFCVNCGGVIPKLDRFASYHSSQYMITSEGRKTDFLLTIGENEKHAVSVRYNTKNKKFTVYVDSTDKPHSIKKVGPKSVSLDVGKDEKHNLTLAINGFWTQRLDATIDGVPVYKGLEGTIGGVLAHRSTK
jgi:hypothetical protein